MIKHSYSKDEKGEDMGHAVAICGAGLLALQLAGCVGPAGREAPGQDGKQSADAVAASPEPLTADTNQGGAGASEASPQLLTADDSEYVTTPVLRTHRSCAHAVPEGATISYEESDVVVSVGGNGGNVVARYPRCRYAPKVSSSFAATQVQAASAPVPDSVVPTVSGWAVYTYFYPLPPPTNAYGFNWYNYMDGQWTVPATPTSQSGQTIFLWNGMENLGSGWILIQPVLQWGPAHNGGGNYWLMDSWVVDWSGNAFWSSPSINVYPGDTVTGVMAGTSCNSAGGCEWQIQSRRQDGTSTSLWIWISVPMQAAFPAVMEPYNLNSCNQYPSSPERFSNTYLYEPGPNPNNYIEVANSLGFIWGFTSSTPQCWYGASRSGRTFTLTY